MRHKLLTVLTLCLALMAGSAMLVTVESQSVEAGVPAGLSCDDLDGCDGSASCDFGSTSGICDIECSDGGKIFCTFEQVQ